MKKTLKVMAMLLFAVTMATMSSCSKEDTYQRRIVGKWERIHVYGVDLNGHHFDNTIENGEIWDFTSEGICTVQSPESTNRYVYSISDSFLVFPAMHLKIMELTNEKMVLCLIMDSASSTSEFRKF